MFNVTTVLPHNLLQMNPCIRHNFSTQVFRKRAAQLHYVGPELRYIFWLFLASFGGQKRPENVNHSNDVPFLCAFTTWRKMTFSFVMSVRMEQLSSYWKNFPEI